MSLEKEWRKAHPEAWAAWKAGEESRLEEEERISEVLTNAPKPYEEGNRSGLTDSEQLVWKKWKDAFGCELTRQGHDGCDFASRDGPVEVKSGQMLRSSQLLELENAMKCGQIGRLVVVKEGKMVVFRLESVEAVP